MFLAMPTYGIFGPGLAPEHKEINDFDACGLVMLTLLTLLTLFTYVIFL